MPLAGKMKLRTFLWLAGGGAAVGIGLLALVPVLLGVSLISLIPSAPEVQGQDPFAPSRPRIPDTGPKITIDSPGFNDNRPPRPMELSSPAAASNWEDEALKYQNQDLGSDKIKDAHKGRPWKLNVYQDAGKSTANRAKVDLDRDDKWDIKYTFEPDGTVLRATAPADDENYAAEEVRTAEGWVPR